METEFIVTKNKIRAVSWNTQRMGYNTPSKLMGFQKTIERLKPDIILLQETANKVVHLKGYNHYVALGSMSGAQHGAVTYFKAELGKFTRIAPKRADIVHLTSPTLGLDILNVYVPPALLPFVLTDPYHKVIDGVLNR